MKYPDKKDLETIREIAKRAQGYFPDVDLVSLEMDLCAVHANIVPLKLSNFLDADEFNFLHDVAGIINNLNRESLELMNCFLPRFCA